MSEVKNKSIIRICQVVQLEDNLSTSSDNYISTNNFGRRIKVIFPEDEVTKNNNNAFFVWPLLPKHLQVIPKVGEMVLVFMSSLDNSNGNRFYIGPIISQDYYLNYCKDKRALSLLQGVKTNSLCHPNGNQKTTVLIPKLIQ